MLSNLLRNSLPKGSFGQLNYLQTNTFQNSYHERVVDHYENPRNVGKLDASDPNVGVAVVGAPACGDVLQLHVRVDDEGRVIESKFKTYGCGSAIASSSLATEWVQGRTLDECLEIKNSDIAKHLSLPPIKKHCSMLAEDAIHAAINNVKQKQKSASL